jgi:hypothetical protein
VVDLEDELKTIGENMKILEVEEEKALAREEKFQARRESFSRARISKPFRELRNRFNPCLPGSLLSPLHSHSALDLMVKAWRGANWLPESSLLSQMSPS